MAMLTDWDDAYTNSAYIKDGESYSARWQNMASSFRQVMQSRDRAELGIPYGDGKRQRYDLFKPAEASQGLLIFIHGGYWLRFDRSDWSHLATGLVENGWSVAMPSYTLAPEASVSQIAGEIAAAIVHIAANSGGPIVLAGHSAGGHLATRMVCSDALLPALVQSRITRLMSISGLHDLRPLLRTAMGSKLFRTPGEAARESPALLEPVADARITCWVGADERPEFLRQTDLLANIWTGLGADVTCHHEPGRHHFDIIDDLVKPGSDMVRRLLGR